MRLLLLIPFLLAPTLFAQDKPSEPDPISAVTVHRTAENEIAAEKLYGGKVLIYRVQVRQVTKIGDSFVIVGIGASSLTGDTVPGSEFRVKRGAEDGFADAKPNSPTEDLVVRAKYVGTSRRFGAYMNRVVRFEDAEFVRYGNEQPKKDK